MKLVMYVKISPICKCPPHVWVLNVFSKFSNAVKELSTWQDDNNYHNRSLLTRVACKPRCIDNEYSFMGD